MASNFFREPPGSFVVAVSSFFCTGCGTCISVCPRKMFQKSERGRVSVAGQGSCVGCLKCSTQCPVHALKVYPVDT